MLCLGYSVENCVNGEWHFWVVCLVGVEEESEPDRI